MIFSSSVIVFPPDRLDEPAAFTRIVTLDAQCLFHEPLPLSPGHVNDHRDAVHHAPTGDFPGKLAAAPCMAQLAMRDKADSALLA